MKRNLFLAACCCLVIGNILAQSTNKFNSPARKLQLAEFAIANLYVNKVDEGNLVKSAIVRMLEDLDRIPLIPIRRK